MKKFLKSVRKLSLLILLSLSSKSCVRGSSNCPHPVFYMEEEQKEIADILERVNEPLLNKWIADYGNLRKFCSM
jgi:hypothetical protein